MTDWPVKTLGQMLELSYGKPLDAKDRDDNGSVPVYGANGVKAYSKKFLVSGPSIIVGRKGSAGELNFCEGPFWPLDVTYYVQHDANETDLSFLHYLLSLMDLPLLAKGVKPGINRNDVYALQAVLPPLEEQKRIVALLDAATARVTELTACYEQARTHANNLFTSALRDALESNPDWPIRTLGQVATFHNGRAYKQQELLDKGKYRVLRVGNFFSSKSWYWSDLELDEHKYCDKGDLLYAWSASFGPRIWDEEKVIYHYHIWKVVEESQQINRQFLKYWLEEDVERVKSASGTGTTMMHVSKGSIEARLISLPPLEEQKQIVARLDSMRAKTSEMVAAYDAKLQAAKNLRQSVLEAAFAGEL